MLRNAFLLLIGFVLFFNVRANNLPKTLSLAATQWCPYVCENNDNMPGIAIEYLTYLTAQLDIELKVSFFPWSRALHTVKSSQLHGLVTAVKSEAPSLKFSTVPTMTYQSCFFTSPNSNWQYQGKDSLTEIKLGVIANYGYGEPIDSYLKKTEHHEHIVQLSGNSGISRLIKLLAAKRLDAYIADKIVSQWVKKQEKLNYQLKIAGCLNAQPFYIALDPNIVWGDELLANINNALQLPKNIEYLNTQIIPKYQ